MVLISYGRVLSQGCPTLQIMNDKIPEALPVAAAKFRAIIPLGELLTSVSSWAVICVILLVLILWLSDSTDVPFIRHLPSIPGLPIVGNLVQLGTEQPRRLAELSKKYGPVFQIRLGNKVSLLI
jgi:Cytochrome P450